MFEKYCGYFFKILNNILKNNVHAIIFLIVQYLYLYCFIIFIFSLRFIAY